MEYAPESAPWEDDDALRYGAGLPRVGTRSLGDGEARAIALRVRRAIARLATVSLGTITAWVAGAAASPALIPEVVDMVGGRWGIAACTGGALGALGALLFGRRPWRLGAAAGLIYLLVVTSLQSLAPETRLPSEWLTWAVVIATVLLGNGYLALACVRGGRILQRRRRILADLEGAVVEQYAGRSATRFVDGSLRRVAGEGWIDDRTGLESHRLELLPRSGLVLRIDGRVVSQIELAHVADVAPAMPHALRVSLPEGVAPSSGSASLDLRRRSLTPAEREELARHIERLRRGYRAPLAATLGAIIVIGSRLWPTFDPAGLIEIPSLLWYGLTLFSYVAYARRVVAAHKLEADRKLRWVVTVDDARPADREPVPPRLEVLPVSQLAWTENAAPAGWRVSKI